MKKYLNVVLIFFLIFYNFRNLNHFWYHFRIQHHRKHTTKNFKTKIWLFLLFLKSTQKFLVQIIQNFDAPSNKQLGICENPVIRLIQKLSPFRHCFLAQNFCAFLYEHSCKATFNSEILKCNKNREWFSTSVIHSRRWKQFAWKQRLKLWKTVWRIFWPYAISNIYNRKIYW